MPETDEEKQKRWAAARAKNAARTPAMEHALQMSKLASQVFKKTLCALKLFLLT